MCLSAAGFAGVRDLFYLGPDPQFEYSSETLMNVPGMRHRLPNLQQLPATALSVISRLLPLMFELQHLTSGNALKASQRVLPEHVRLARKLLTGEDQICPSFAELYKLATDHLPVLQTELVRDDATANFTA